MSKKEKFKQVAGIIIGVVLGHTLVNAFFGSRRQAPPQQQQSQVPYQAPQINNQGVFEQALLKWSMVRNINPEY